MHQETSRNFLGIFARKIKRAGVQIARTEVCITKTQEKTKETKAHSCEAQNPRNLVDPDPPNASEALDQSGSPKT